MKAVSTAAVADRRVPRSIHEAARDAARALAATPEYLQSRREKVLPLSATMRRSPSTPSTI
jgi:hypothetical protein